MKQKRLALLAVIILLLIAGFYVGRHVYWLTQPGLPVYP